MAVKTIQKTAMPRNQVAAVFNASFSFEVAFEKVANLGNNASKEPKQKKVPKLNSKLSKTNRKSFKQIENEETSRANATC